jgi:acetyl/propionyl-CoA carboxylase alpha subunit/acetyl-CoA carboxylase carboxyltransferase component
VARHRPDAASKRPVRKLLIANRGEIAIRIARTVSDLGLASVAVFSEDDEACLHARRANETVRLSGWGPAAYLDIGQIVEAARASGCDAVHPGYGFLSESAAFASACAKAGLVFVGPDPDHLRLFGDKLRARRLALRCGVPVLPGTDGAASLEAAQRLLESLGPGGAVMIKAVAGGGGRGMRPVRTVEDLPAAFERCRSEAERSFGSGSLYAEALLPAARHIEVQVIGDGSGAVSHIWDRECSLQRRCQKLVEVAPAIGLDEEVRQNLLAAATAMARAASYRNLGTFEFLVPMELSKEGFYFIEANPRLQVEHTVTEEITGLDLVALQIGLASGRTLEDLGVLQADVPEVRGVAVETRVNLETMSQDGSVNPASGVIEVYEPPSGPGVRVDGYGYAGYRTIAGFDSLLAKTIVHWGSNDPAAALRKAGRALSEFRIEGVASNIPFLKRLLASPAVNQSAVSTAFVDEHLAEFLAPGGNEPPRRRPGTLDRADPLAILDHGRAPAGQEIEGHVPFEEPVGPVGTVPLRAPIQGTIVSFAVTTGQRAIAGKPVVILEAMKMEHEVASADGGVVRALAAEVGETVAEGQVLAFIEPAGEAGIAVAEQKLADPDFIRPDLAEALERRRLLADEARPVPVERRHGTGLRTPRENIADLCDPGSFVEFGGLTVAARRMKNSLEDLVRTTPADGMIMGTARVNGAVFPDERSRCALLSYDPTVMAGTQGMKGHEKLDRMLELAARSRLPVIFFTEGGGGRPGDTDKLGVGFNFIRSFAYLGQLSGLVPIVGVNNGRCFAGNAFILGCCDVVIATESSTIGIGGPAVIEGAGLGVYKPEEVGPVSMQAPNGVIDVLVQDEPAAVAAAKKYLGYFQGPLAEWRCADQRRLRSLIPENHRRAYDMRRLIETLADEGSVLELRPRFGPVMITALVRIEGRPLGLLANNPHFQGGAIDSQGSDKAARFMQLCEAHGLPILSLCDTPGYMIGPEAEKTALIRHCARVVVVGANLTVPMMIIVVRKGYGLGGLAMAGGSFSNCVMAIAWPTGEFGGMPVEGYVKLGFRDELAAIDDLTERQARYEEMVARMYEEGKAVNAASFFEFDDVIDPVDSRRRIVEALRSTPPRPRGDGKHIPWLDTW